MMVGIKGGLWDYRQQSCYHLFQSKVVGIYTDTISNGLPCENNHVNATFAV